jgi:predicted transcriptional regulator
MYKTVHHSRDGESMARKRPDGAEPLSRRERQVMTFIYARGEATAAEIFDGHDFPTYNAARSTLRVLEGKGHLTHEMRDRSYVYRSTVPPDRVRGSWLSHLVSTLFGGSATALVNTLIDEHIASDEELARLERLIRKARASSRKGASRR